MRHVYKRFGATHLLFLRIGNDSVILGAEPRYVCRNVNENISSTVGATRVRATPLKYHSCYFSTDVSVLRTLYFYETGMIRFVLGAEPRYVCRNTNENVSSTVGATRVRAFMINLTKCVKQDENLFFILCSGKIKKYYGGDYAIFFS